MHWKDGIENNPKQCVHYGGKKNKSHSNGEDQAEIKSLHKHSGEVKAWAAKGHDCVCGSLTARILVDV